MSLINLTASHPKIRGLYCIDMSVLAAPAMFEEHCRCHANVLYYSNCSKVAKRKREFFVDEMVKAVGTPGKLHRWCNRLIAFPLPDPPASVFTTSHNDTDVVSPVHLIVDALASVNVLPPDYWLSYQGHRDEMQLATGLPVSFFDSENDLQIGGT